MSYTASYIGSLQLTALLTQALSGDYGSGVSAKSQINRSFSGQANADSVPTGGGRAVITLAGGANSLLLGNTTPFAGFAWMPGFDPGGKKLVGLLLINLDATYTVAVIRGATNGLPIFDAASHGVTLAANGGAHLYLNPAGLTLTSGSNDLLTLTPSGGTPQVEVWALYE